MKNQKGVSSIIFIIIIIALLVVAGYFGYQYYTNKRVTSQLEVQNQNQQNQNQQNQITPQQNNITVQPSITVLSPNGGEVFKEEGDIIVKWTSENVEKVYIRAWYYDANGIIGVPDRQNYSFNEGQCRITYDSVSASLGSYAIKGGSIGKCGILEATDRIKIEITAQDNSAKDTSDNYFTIIK